MGTNGDKSLPARKLSAWSPHIPDVGGVDPAIHNSNTSKFRGARLAVPYAEDHRFPEEVALEALRQFMDGRGQVPTADQWAAAGLSPSEKTIRRQVRQLSRCCHASR